MTFKNLRVLLCFCLIVIFSLTSCQSSVKRHQWRIARDPTWYPLNLAGLEKYVFAFSDDLLMNIARMEKFQVELLGASWESLEPSLLQGRCDAMLSSIEPLMENNDRFSFSDPYLLLGPVLVIPFTSTVTSVEQMEGKIIAVQSGSQSLNFLIQFPQVIIRPYENLAMALEDLKQGVIDAVFMPILEAGAYCRDLYAGELKVGTPPMGGKALRLVTLKDQAPQLIQSFNNGLKELKATGAYDTLEKKWSIK